MKILIPTLVFVTVGCMAHGGPATAIKPVPPVPPVPAVAPLPPEEDVLIVAQAPAATPAPAVPPKPARGAVVSAGSGGAMSLGWSGDGPFKFSSSSVSRRTIVIPKGEANPEMLANAEEDLNVMTVILEKALEQRGEEDGRKALGIDVSSSGIRNMLIEGHGAIFTLKTRMALVAPPTPKKEEETKTKDATSSEWEKARREIYGRSEVDKEIEKAFKHAEKSFSSGEEYDAGKVQRLKESLADSLKSAANIRGLSGDQTVTVIVLSSTSMTEVHKVMTELRGLNRFGTGRADVYAKADREREWSDSRSSGSRMMLQAKKSDIDAFAKGKLTSEAFRDKVKIQVY